jgi:DNA-binding transcriptional MerR regulator
MELLDLPQLAERADLPVSLARYYRDRFILFVPTVRVGRTLLHPPEAITVLRLIADQARSGVDSGVIETALERAYPVTVITSQDVCGDGSIPGAAGVVNALASVIDERGARIESEVASLRAQLETNAEIERLRDAEAQSRSDIDALTSKTLAEVDQIKIGVEEIRSRHSTLASHEQLEWIGDVVAAAVLRPAETGSQSSVERQLGEIHEELRKPRPDADVAELRIAVERLSEHVHARDREYFRAVQSLVDELRSEIGSVQMRISELNRSVQIDARTMPLLLTGHRHDSNGSDANPADHDRGETKGDSTKSRAPRRLGQLNKPQDFVIHDHGSAPGSE